MGSRKPMCRLSRVLCVLSLAFMFSLSMAGAVRAEPENSGLWEDLRSGRAVALMRHALAPGTGDPPNFKLGDCSTQRILSEEGRQQARALGDLFRKNGIARAEVRSSRWCRCLETSELLDLGGVRKTPFLDSFFAERAKQADQTEAAKAAIHAHLEQGDGPLVLVTHQVNITALSGVYPASGEIVLLSLDPDGSALNVAGRLRQDF